MAYSTSRVRAREALAQYVADALFVELAQGHEFHLRALCEIRTLCGITLPDLMEALFDLAESRGYDLGWNNATSWNDRATLRAILRAI